MRPLLITPEIKEAGRKLRELAASHPVSREELMTIGQRARTAEERIANLDYEAVQKSREKRKHYSDQLELPFGFRIAYSVEDQPSGMCGHVSISVDRPGKLPNPAAVREICKQLFDFDYDNSIAVWLEEFEPGHKAVNIVHFLTLPGARAKQ